MKNEWNKKRLADKEKFFIFMSTERNERRICDDQVNCRPIVIIEAFIFDLA